MSPIEYFSHFCAFCCGSRDKERDKDSSKESDTSLKPNSRRSAYPHETRLEETGEDVSLLLSCTTTKEKTSPVQQPGDFELWRKASVMSIMLPMNEAEEANAYQRQNYPRGWLNQWKSISLTDSSSLEENSQTQQK